MNFSATVSVKFVGAANADLSAQGFGGLNFSVPAQSPGAPAADYAGFHTWGDDAFRLAVESLPAEYGIVVTVGDGAPNFETHCTKNVLTWVPYSGDNADLYMKDDVTAYDGKTWICLADKNPYVPPVGWREQAPAGTLPAWVQPVSSIDAYPIGFKVSHKGADWMATVDACVWEPSVFGWDEISTPVDEWPPFQQPTHAGNVYMKGDKVTFEGKHYESLIENNSWSPSAYPAGWAVRP